MKKSFLIISIIVIGICASACSSDTIWGMTKTEFLTRIEHGNTEFLRHLDYTELDHAQIFQTGPGGAYGIGLLFDNLGMEELSETFLRLGWEQGFGPWRRMAGESLLRTYLDAEEYQKAEQFAAEMILQLPEFFFGHRGLLTALYWQQKNEAVLEKITEIESRFPGETENDWEIRLFEAVTLVRIGPKSNYSLFTDLFAEAPPSGVLIRGYKFITADADLEALFSSEELQFFNARVFGVTGRWKEASEIYIELLESKSSLIRSDVVYQEAGTALLYGDARIQGAEALLEHDQEKDSFYSLFSSGRIYRGTKQYEEAAALFAEAAKIPDPETEAELIERARWYRLDCLLKQDTDRFIRELPAAASVWEDPDYYSDLLEDLAVELVGLRDWETVYEVYTELMKTDAVESTMKFGFLTAAAADAGYLKTENRKDFPSYKDIVELGEKSFPYHYYLFLAASELDILPENLAQAVAGERAEGAEGEAESNIERETEKSGPDTTGDQIKGDQLSAETGEKALESVLETFLQFRLLDHAFSTAMEKKEQLSKEIILRTAAALQEEGRFREGIILVSRYRQSLGEGITKTEMELLFPRGYFSLIGGESEKYEFYPPFFTALVREESYFDPDAVSHAGAVGLSQLMPATAEDTARRMGMDSYDVRNPGDNLAIGAYYFDSLLDRFDGTAAYAVASYNAGPTRMRRWEKSFEDLPLQLQVEAIPIDETRRHVQKVLVSSVVYGYLYDGTSPNMIIKRFFSGRQE